MSDVVLVALIGAAGSVVGVLLSFPLLSYRVSQLEKKVDKHNSIVEKVYRIEQDLDYIKRDVEGLKNERKVCQTN